MLMWGVDGRDNSTDAFPRRRQRFYSFVAYSHARTTTKKGGCLEGERGARSQNLRREEVTQVVAVAR